MPHLEREGVKLWYDEAGSGPAIVFVHGWCCDHTHFAPQAEYFARDYRVVSVDLRGHGESDKPTDPYSMELFAGDVAWLCEQLGIRRTIAVGHSMGGSVVAALAAHHPDLVRGAVAVDSAVITSPGARERLGPRIDAFGGPGYIEAATEFVTAMFEPYDDPVRRGQIMRGMTSVPQHTMVSSMRANLAQDAAALGMVKQPFLVISAGRFPVDQAALREVIPNFRYAQTYGSGHFSQLEVPDQVNAMIERFMAIELLAET